MKAAFAKMLEKNPTQSSQVAFRAGGNGVPILTRASSQSTAGYQTMGLPDGSRPMPGGGANKTVLGIYRMGETDGVGAASAIIGNPGDIFSPIAEPAMMNPERTFANVGNNVFQPQYDDRATIALLNRLGDQKFKAESQAPFEDYRAQQRLARDLEEASRNAGLNDLGLSREIIRNLAAQRRQQNEDDYLRKMLDAGATPEAAKKEIEDVRNANAIQEAKKVEDREYQAKTLIQRLAMSRGVTPMVREPLNQSSSIDNPQRSQAMSQAMGMPGEGFGTSPLDMNRQFMTPDFYKKFLRRSTVSQEASDEASAFSNLITSGEIPAPASGTFSMATLRGQERQQQVEIAAEGLASRLDAIRQRQNRIKRGLATPIVGEDILKALYRSKSKSVGEKVLFSPETIDSLSALQLLITINNNVERMGSAGAAKLSTEVKKYNWIVGGQVSPKLLADLRLVAYAMNNSEQSVRIPFPSATNPDGVTAKTYADLFQNIKNDAVPGLEEKARRGRIRFVDEESRELQPGEFEVLPELDQAPVPGAPGKNVTNTAFSGNKKLQKRIPKMTPGVVALQALVRGGQARQEVRNLKATPGVIALQALVRGAQTRARLTPDEAVGGAAESAPDYTKFNVKQLKEALKSRNLSLVGNKADLLARLFASE
jgi:hypothetical protein